MKMFTTFFIICRLVKDPETINRISSWLDEQYVSYMHLEDTGWFANFEMTAIEVRDNLLHLIDSEDFLFVMEAGPGWSGWNLNEHQVHWLQKNWRPGILRLK